MVLGSVFSPDRVKMSLEGEDKDEVFEELVDLYVSRNPSASRSAILAAIRGREAKLSTGVKTGFALPHAQTDQVDGVCGIVGISRPGVDYDALDGKPVHVVFMIPSSAASGALQLRALKRLAALLDDPQFLPSLISQKDAAGVHAALCRFEDVLTSAT